MKKILAIIGVVVLLVGAVYLVKVYTTVNANARTSKLNDDVSNLFAGLQQYKDHIGAYPVGGNAQVVKALLGHNPKNIIILVSRKTELNEKGEFVDPWGTPLKIYFADNNVLVRSAGANRRFDDSASIDFDDYIRSN
jgi:uncharacterized protein YxeA